MVRCGKPMVMAIIAMCSQMAVADSSVSVYGLIDLSVDQVTKTEGNVQGTLFGLNGVTPVPNSTASPHQSVTRMGSSLTGQSVLGFKGTEDMGGGLVAKFQLETALVPDTGQTATANRLFGKQAWVGLTTPGGEFRFGRQAAPMVVSYYLNSLERLGSMDLIAAGVTMNNLQINQDNMVSYTAQVGKFLGQASYSPNAGVASRISAARSTATSTTPLATPGTGEIVGGATAGGENSEGRGKAYGAFGAYIEDNWRVIASVHRNNFRAPAGLATMSGGFVPLFNLNAYQSWMLGGKYKLASSGTEFALNYHQGRFTDSSGMNPRVVTMGAAIKQTLGQVSLIAQACSTQFTNFTKGKDTAFMLGADYHLSKRTALYIRAGQLSDDRGKPVTAPLTPLGVAGGPMVLLLPLGALEIPLFSGAGANMDAETRVVGIGMRHTF